MCCYKGETFVDVVLETRGQQTGDQSPPGHGALCGVTAEGDAVARTVSSGNTLKHAVSAPSAEHRTAIPMGMGRGREVFISPVGIGSPSHTSGSAPGGVSA